MLNFHITQISTQEIEAKSLIEYKLRLRGIPINGKLSSNLTTRTKALWTPSSRGLIEFGTTLTALNPAVQVRSCRPGPLPATIYAIRHAGSPHRIERCTEYFQLPLDSD